MPEPSRGPRHEIEILRGRFSRFLTTVLEPAVWGEPSPLEIAAWQTAARVPFDIASASPFQPVKLGWRWGPAWSTCWFRLRGVYPDHRGRPLDLRFSTRTECTVWIDGLPGRGLDNNRDSVELPPKPAGTPIEVYIEAACNHPFGISTFDWDISDTHDRWRSADPGHLVLACLAARNEPVRRLVTVYRFAARLLDELDPASPEARTLFDALAEATRAVDDRAVERTADAARAILERALHTHEAPNARGIAVGHAHIDTAWLWPLEETRRKIVRSWTNALEVMDRHPGASFICSQAQQYAWLEHDAPEVFDRLSRRVAEGRFTPMGGMWVEPDANVPSAESLIRQVLHADRYWRSRFGDKRGRQHTLYLPDTFGFPACLPTIMRATGLDLFITNKLSWNQATPYAFTNHRWSGLGGAEVLAHNTPNHDYNCTNAPKELRRTLANLRPHPDATAAPQPFLHPYGFGDGGGGPTLEQAEAVDLAASHPALPPLRHGVLGEFRQALRSLDETLPSGLPRVEGEQYLELHRGTLTTHAWLKAANRELELSLRLAEVLAFAGPTPPDPTHATRTAARLDAAWKLLLLQQFHDILPGSSITRVYDQCRGQLAEVRGAALQTIAASLAAWADSAEKGEPLAVLNPASSTRSGVVEHRGTLRWAERVPALGVAPLESGPTPHPVEISPEGVLRNGLIEARIDRSGRVASLRRIGGPELAEQPLNRLVLYRDIPMNWDAWDLDAYTEEEPLWANESPADSWRVRIDSPLRAEIEVVRTIGDASKIAQVFRLDAGSPRLDIVTWYQWNERHRLLRAEMSTGIRAARASYEIQGGFIERPTTRDTMSERMMFEVCAHRWMDLGEPGRGLALLNTGRFGHGCHGGRMHLSLLRAPSHPDPTAGRDQGTVTYSLLPHDGNWRAAEVDREAESLNAPLRVIGAGGRRWAPVEVTEAPGQRLEITALKPAEDDPARLVLRLIETRGVGGTPLVRWRLPVRRFTRCDALERPIDPVWAHAGDSAEIEVEPHGIVTLVAERA